MVVVAFVEPDSETGVLGEQVAAACGCLAQLDDCCLFLFAAERGWSRVPRGGPGDFGYGDPIVLSPGHPHRLEQRFGSVRDDTPAPWEQLRSYCG